MPQKKTKTLITFFRIFELIFRYKFYTEIIDSEAKQSFALLRIPPKQKHCKVAKSKKKEQLSFKNGQFCWNQNKKIERKKNLLKTRTVTRSRNKSKNSKSTKM